MTLRIGLIVEGHGEVHAAPVLMRRIVTELGAADVTCGTPHRVPRGKLAKEDELKRAIELVARKIGAGMPILVLMDADDDCPVDLGTRLVGWAREVRADRRIEVVLANREYEAWFVAAAASLAGHRTLRAGVKAPPDAEAPRSPKGWLHERMTNGYTETVDQPAFSGLMDLRQAASASSFRKLLRSVATLLDRDVPSYAR